MKQPFLADEHWRDAEGRPAGGVTSAVGLTISWQNGPLGRGAERREPNGAFVETVIEAAISRLSAYQRSPFNCAENEEAIEHLLDAKAALERRTASREARGVEGTHGV